MIGARQGTIARACEFEGHGLHTGRRARIRCLPAAPQTGIVFTLAAGPAIPATLGSVVETKRGIVLGRDGRVVRTVEHLLASLNSLGIANARIDVEGEELPALDGSALPYVRALQDAGLVTQDAWRAPIVPSDPVYVAQGQASILVLPASTPRISYVVPTGVDGLGVQFVDIVDPTAAFEAEIAPARTWGFAAELEALRAEGLALGASEENTLGLGPAGYLWPARFPDEPARHKVLDLIGDLALLGRPVLAHIVAVAAGHALHVEVARRIAALAASD